MMLFSYIYTFFPHFFFHCGEKELDVRSFTRILLSHLISLTLKSLNSSLHYIWIPKVLKLICWVSHRDFPHWHLEKKFIMTFKGQYSTIQESWGRSLAHPW